MDTPHPEVVKPTETEEVTVPTTTTADIKEETVSKVSETQSKENSNPEKTKQESTPNTVSNPEADEARQAEQKRKLNNIMAAYKGLMGLHYLKNDGIPIEVLPNLYIGSVGAALNRKGLEEYGINAILCCCETVKQKFSQEISHKYLPLLDKETEDIKKYFDEASLFVHECIEAARKTLIHCFAGKSRSTTIMIASYLVKYKKMTVQDALELIKQKRPSVCPNQGFMKQLLEYEKELQGLSQ